MKSAYEIAMEKLRKSSGPQKSLTDAQKRRIAEIEKKYEAKTAEARMTFDRRLAAAPPAERAAVQDERVTELARIERQRDAEKESVWSEAAD